MSNLRRIDDPRDLYFITNVTFERNPLLIDHFDLLWRAIRSLQAKGEFDLQAWVILPDHFHLLIDTDGRDISNLLQRVKMSFAALYRKRANLRSARVWQNRFWDHIIRDMDDRNRHLDYIHYNPVKHGHVSSPFEWEYSSIHDFRKQGFYASDWGVLPISVGGDYGE